MSEEVVEVPLSLASPAIAKYTGQPAPNYRSLWQMVVDGQLTGIRRNGRWYLSPAKAAQELGLIGAKKSAF